MAPPLSQKKRKLQDGMRGKTDRPKKRFRKQKEYHSSSEEDSDEAENGFAAVNLEDSDDETPPQKAVARNSPKTLKKKRQLEEQSSASEREDEQEEEQGASDGDDADGSDEDQLSGTRRKNTTKRNDPTAFSTSIAKILSTKLSQSARKDPVLSRSRDAVETSATLANERLERKAKAKLRAEKREELERGRVRDVLGLSSGQAGEVVEEEKRLRKIAQRGVVKLFNAVRAAQVQGEAAAREERRKGTIGLENRQEKVNEISKQGFLDLIGGGNKAAAATSVQS